MYQECREIVRPNILFIGNNQAAGFDLEKTNAIWGFLQEQEAGHCVASLEYALVSVDHPQELSSPLYRLATSPHPVAVIAGGAGTIAHWHDIERQFQEKHQPPRKKPIPIVSIPMGNYNFGEIDRDTLAHPHEVWKRIIAQQGVLYDGLTAYFLKTGGNHPLDAFLEIGLNRQASLALATARQQRLPFQQRWQRVLDYSNQSTPLAATTITGDRGEIFTGSLFALAVTPEPHPQRDPQKAVRPANLDVTVISANGGTDRARKATVGYAAWQQLQMVLERNTGRRLPEKYCPFATHAVTSKVVFQTETPAAGHVDYEHAFFDLQAWDPMEIAGIRQITMEPIPSAMLLYS